MTEQPGCSRILPGHLRRDRRKCSGHFSNLEFWRAGLPADPPPSITIARGIPDPTAVRSSGDFHGASVTMARIVVVIPEPLVHLHGGDELYTFHWLQQLSRRHDVHLVSLRGGGKPTPSVQGPWSVHQVSQKPAGSKRLRQVLAICSGRTMQESQINYPGCAADLSRLIRRLQPDVVMLHHIRAAWVARYWTRPDCRVAYVAHNCEGFAVHSLSQMDFGYAARAALRWEAKKLRALETRLLSTVDMCVCLSDEDVTRFKPWSTRATFDVVPPTVNPVACEPRQKIRHSMLLVGSYDWAPEAQKRRLVGDASIAPRAGRPSARHAANRRQRGQSAAGRPRRPAGR